MTGVNPAIFQDLQARVDEDTAVRDELKDIIQALEKQISDVLGAAKEPIDNVVETVGKLSQAASKMPYYKFNNMWSRQMQGAVCCGTVTTCNVGLTASQVEGLLFWGWLGGYKYEGGEIKCGQLLTIEDLGEILHIPVNLKDRDEFHLTIEEYLQSLISLVEELTRLARNAVTLGDYERPLLINQFVKDLHAGFQILNLKNDSLRRRSDGLKYRVKDVEDVVYDLSLRNLLPKKE
ncbi:hypothetical protein SNOG_10047 [Parastagonospora nodorum SN15]|uniref:Translin n=1 Tax=Phaeosphaeria nodorum (strain SN15 / ATCC MYA-4574 / FGSC 10173) TaxID=321614 RepID=Q0UDW7_PHANO|nr:hypothetical protein SNOG_10047 [Parastagonospora nodorum SN15]EAT82382.2 hypothetical protein SNOG_10047 [Parastagonospora nodorum SN15]